MSGFSESTVHGVVNVMCQSIVDRLLSLADAFRFSGESWTGEEVSSAIRDFAGSLAVTSEEVFGDLAQDSGDGAS